MKFEQSAGLVAGPGHFSFSLRSNGMIRVGPLSCRWRGKSASGTLVDQPRGDRVGGLAVLVIEPVLRPAACVMIRFGHGTTPVRWDGWRFECRLDGPRLSRRRPATRRGRIVFRRWFALDPPAMNRQRQTESIGDDQAGIEHEVDPVTQHPAIDDLAGDSDESQDEEPERLRRVRVRADSPTA